MQKKVTLQPGRIAREQMLIRMGKKPEMVLPEELEKIRRDRQPVYVLNSLKLNRGERFLDIGSGPMAAVAAWKRGAIATGMDTDATKVSFGRKLAGWAEGRDIEELNMLSLTKIRSIFRNPEKISDNVRFMYGKPTRLPFPGSSVDKIMSLGYIHQLEPLEREQALREMLRVAKDGALIKVRSAPYLSEMGRVNAAIRLCDLAKEMGYGVKVVIKGKGIATTIRLFKKKRE